jgi:hypothetical protein
VTGLGGSAVRHQKGAPSGTDERIIELLALHRVLTTQQLIRITTLPERTVDYRLQRLHKLRLVTRSRPYRERGSAPFHWWLTRPGAALTAAPTPRRPVSDPNPLFLAHTAAIADVWIALSLQGPSAGLELVRWVRDESAWEMWFDGGRKRRIAPDALAELAVSGDSVECFIEVDRATMTVGRLREKLRRYAAYDAAGAWRAEHAHCPVVLFLTTSPARVAHLTSELVEPRRGPGPRPLDREEGGRGASLVVAAAPGVHAPETAVIDTVWTPVPPGPPRALSGLLGEVVATRLAAERQLASERTRTEAERPWVSFDWLCQYLGADRVDADLRPLVSVLFAPSTDHENRQDPSRWVPSYGDLFVALAEDLRRAGTMRRPPVAPALQDRLRDLVPELWRDQATYFLGQEHDQGDPRVAHDAAVLAAGRILGRHDRRSGRGEEWDRVAARIDWPGYCARRESEIAAQWRRLPRAARRRTAPELLAAAYDEQHLLACSACGLRQPRPSGTGASDRCQLDGQQLVPVAEAPVAPALERSLAEIRLRLGD